MSANAAHFDDNQVPTVMGAIGTLGTADTGGTAKSLPFAIDDATGAGFVKVINGTITAALALDSGTITTIQAGTLNTLGTVSNINNGSINILTGTVTSVTTVSNLTNGSINILTGTVTEASNLAKGTITRVEGGTLGVVSSVAELVKGTVTLVTTVTTLSNLTNGSINILTGTITSLSNLVKGTITKLEGGTLGEVTAVTTVSNLTNGSVNILTGTVTRLSNVGTLETGTVQLNPVPIYTLLSHGTLGTAGGSFFATISAAAGAGTKHYVSGIDIVMQSGTADVRILAGTAIQGTGVLAAGQFPAGGGISKTIFPVFATGTNSELTYHFVGAGTAFITVQYWKGV